MTTTPPKNLDQPTPEPAKGKSAKAFAVAAVVCGVLGFIPVLGVIFCIAAFILSIIALKRSVVGSTATIGLITSLAALAVGQPLDLVLIQTAMDSNKTPALHALCAANCNAIGKAIALYSEDNAGMMPPDLEVLIKKDIIGRRTLSCTVLNPALNASKRGCDYFYLPAAPNANPLTIILCDYKGNHEDRTRSVLYMDFSIKWRMSESEFQAELAKPCNAAFAKALREAEGP